MRKRLTAKTLKAESRLDGIFPGDIGNEERDKNYHDVGEYSNYELQEGWDIPEKNIPKIDDKRDEIGFGIPKTADIFQTAKAATVLAQMYLGDSAPDVIVEDQARDFMKLGHRRIVAAIKRWKATEPAPAVEETEEKTCPECASAPEACKAGEVEVPAVEEKAQAPVTATEDVAPIATTETTEIESNADELTEPIEANEEEAPEMELEIPPAAEEVSGPSFAGSEDLNQAVADPELEALFAGEELEDIPMPAEESPVAKKASKQGVKHLGGQPKIASAESFGVKELEGIWTDLKIPCL